MTAASTFPLDSYLRVKKAKEPARHDELRLVELGLDLAVDVLRREQEGRALRLLRVAHHAAHAALFRLGRALDVPLVAQVEVVAQTPGDYGEMLTRPLRSGSP